MAFKKKGRGHFNPEGPVRVRFPREGEILGIIEQLHGFAKMKVKCVDGKTRMCRVPGKLTIH